MHADTDSRAPTGRGNDTLDAARKLIRKWEAIAIAQLCAMAEQLHEENIQLRRDLRFAEDAAESWRDDALQAMQDLIEATGGRPGLTVSGALVVVK